MPGWIWLVLGMVLLGVEVTRGDLYLFGFGVGALVAALLSLTGLVPLEWAAFLFAGFGSLGLLRPRWLKRLSRGSGAGLPDPMDRLLGKQGKVVETITSIRAGAVEISGRRWLASALDESEIAVGSIVEVYGVEGTTLGVLLVSPPEGLPEQSDGDRGSRENKGGL